MKPGRLILAVVVLLVLGGCGIGCVGVVGTAVYLALPSGGSVLNPQSGEEAVWGKLAEFIDKHPERFTDTDRVYAIAQQLQLLGEVSSIDRLNSFKAEMQPITDANRAAVVGTVKGGR